MNVYVLILSILDEMVMNVVGMNTVVIIVFLEFVSYPWNPYG